MTLFENNSCWSSSTSFDQFEWNDIFFGKDLGLFLQDPIELIPEDDTLRSIHFDCKKIESSSGSISPTTDMSSEYLDLENDSKYEIRNHDCMWSGVCTNNTTNKKQQQIIQQTPQLKRQIKEEIINSNSDTLTFKNSQIQQNNTIIGRNIDITTIKQEIMTTQQQQQQTHNVQSVPPGTSLLLNSRIAQQKKKQQMINFTIPNVTTMDFLREREVMPIARPDTPSSLDDDPPEFKHTVDLAACVMGSNNICLETDTDTDKLIINKLKEQLEDTTTKNLDIRQILPGKNRSLSEVLNVIESENSMQPLPSMITPKIEPDDIDDDDEDDDDEEEDSEIDDLEEIIPKNKVISGMISTKASAAAIHSSLSNSEINDTIAHDDHCYTRSNGAIDVVGMGLETPSDSDEEIDVVSIGDKKLPNNPSDRDRRVLQTKVANKISARIVKTVNGIRTIPPRRRCSYEPYTAPVTPVKGSSSSSNSRYPTPATTPFTTYQQQQQQHNTNYHYHHSLSSTPATTTTVTHNNSNISHSSRNSTTNSRKRSAPASKDDQNISTSNKRHRSKKHKSSNRKHNYVMDEAETIEKRNLHNDMERQRRIGLKNLFEALKKHIPSIKDKERAPKVNILREAAKYCELLNREDKILMAQKHQLQLQQQRRIAQIQILQMSNMQFKEESIED